jgi:integrase
LAESTSASTQVMLKSTCITAKETVRTYLEKLRLNGAAFETIETVKARLNRLAKEVDIDNPYEVKDALARLKWSNSTKHLTAILYAGYLAFIGKKWETPKYKRDNPIPFIPTEKEIDTLIAGSRIRQATLLTTLKETAARIGEVIKIEWKDIDLERRLVTINHPEKYSLPRTVPISNTLITMLNKLKRKDSRVFPSNAHALRTNYEYVRNRIATKLSNPRLKEIHFHTFRHWKATMLYHETKDIMHVKSFLGHKDINNTVIYINIEQALFLEQCDQWVSKVAHNEQEETELINAGFEHVNNRGELAFYRKRK